MDISIQAHFDGVHLVPDEPVDLPIGTRLRVLVETPTADASLNDEVPQMDEAPQMIDDLLAPVIVGLDREVSVAIGSDAEFEAENL